MSARCFMVKPTGDGIYVFPDGRPDKVGRYVSLEPGERETGPEYDGWRTIKPRYRRVDTGEVFDSFEACGPGAMTDAAWLHDFRRGPDGRSLYVICPDGWAWFIDGRASNCTMPDDDEHYCWVREGEPPNVTVGKAGRTCAAGAGSIQTPNYHGFLRHGAFEP